MSPICSGAWVVSRVSSPPITSMAPPNGPVKATDALSHSDGFGRPAGRPIELIVGRLMGGRTLAVAESCTGGMLAARLTDEEARAFVKGLRALTEGFGSAPGEKN